MARARPAEAAIAILPCNDIEASERFYNRLGFASVRGEGHADYRTLTRAAGGQLHLTKAEPGWLVPGRNPFAIYVYAEDVDGLAASLTDLLPQGRGPEDKPWGMYELALSDPDETLVRVGWPSDLHRR